MTVITRTRPTTDPMMTGRRKFICFSICFSFVWKLRSERRTNLETISTHRRVGGHPGAPVILLLVAVVNPAHNTLCLLDVDADLVVLEVGCLVELLSSQVLYMQSINL